MKRKPFCRLACVALLCAALALLPGCSAKVDTTPVWQKTLENSGVQIELANCTVLDETPVDYTTDAHNYDWIKMPAVQTDGVTVLTVYGAATEQVKLEFAWQVDTLYLPYPNAEPQEKVDYLLTEGEGWQRYQLDTATSYFITISSDTGSDTFLLGCHRSDVQ